MQFQFNDSVGVLEQAKKEELIKDLLTQVQKDFTRANASIQLDSNLPISNLVTLLQEKIYVLVLEKYQEFLNLLYAVDIPESQILKLASKDPVDLSSEVCFLILKREWQKVWFRHKFNS